MVRCVISVSLRNAELIAVFRQAKFSAEDIEKVAQVLEVPHANIQAELGDHWWPNRGIGPMPPTDPVIYRLYEVV